MVQKSPHWLWTLIIKGRSPLAQRDLEIQILVTVKMDLSEKIYSALASTRLYDERNEPFHYKQKHARNVNCNF